MAYPGLTDCANHPDLCNAEIEKLPDRKFNVSVNDSKIKSYCLFPQSFSSVKIQIFLFVTILDMSLI
jgi:hypothetical protein